MVEKRSVEQNGHGAPDAKRPRTDGAVPAKPVLNLEALQKAKLLLEKKKELQEKLKKLPKVAGTAAGAPSSAAVPSAAALAAAASPLSPAGNNGPAAGPPGFDAAIVAARAAKAVEIASKFGVQASLASVPVIAAASAAAPRPLLALPALSAGGVRPPLVPGGMPGAGPRPLRLDASGREVDEAGNVILPSSRPPITTSLINQRHGDESAPPAEPAGPRDEDFVDPSMPARPPGRRSTAVAAARRRRGALEFVEEGTFQRQAELMRLKQKYGEADFRKHLPAHLRRPPRGPAGPAERAPAGAANLTPLGAPPIPGLAGLGLAADGQLSGANLVPIGAKQVEVSEEDKMKAKLPELNIPVPEVEWWDKPLLEGGVYFSTTGQQQQQQQQEQQQGQPLPHQQQANSDNAIATAPGNNTVMRLRLGKLTRYVEHPVLLEPPAAGPPPPPQPLKLTKRELKKLRTQRRQAREKEKQELIRQGLLEPPKPKVKISNLMRVLGEQATLDPTAIEQEVRRQMGERQAAHDDRNLARMLTPAEKRDKKLRKLFDTGPGGGLTTQTAVYRVEDLSNGQHRFKVDVNAKENQMSGVMLICPSTFGLVVVEGCPKSLKRYHRLMLRRIDWTATSLPALGDEGDDPDADEAAQGNEEKTPNSCHLVWQGVVKAAVFKDFTKEEVASPEAARKLLEDKGVAHYWDAAANFDTDAAHLWELP